MTAEQPSAPDHEAEVRVEQLIGNLLRAGVLLSAAVVAVGGALFLIHYGGTTRDYHVFRGEPEQLRSVPGVIRAAWTLDSAAIIQLGLVLLLATPIARVALSLIVFARQRDRLYVAVSATVLALLLLSLFAGRGVA
jgi:uncharacterized membrane protein